MKRLIYDINLDYFTNSKKYESLVKKGIASISHVDWTDADEKVYSVQFKKGTIIRQFYVTPTKSNHLNLVIVMEDKQMIIISSADEGSDSSYVLDITDELFQCSEEVVETGGTNYEQDS